jgi:hypothetical protein
MNGWKAKISSVVTALLGSLLMMKGLGENTQWADVPGLFTPLAVIGLAIVLWRAWSGTGQFKMPEGMKKLGNK